MYRKHQKERERETTDCKGKVTRAKKWSDRKRETHAHEGNVQVHPLTFCPPAELNDPFGVPLGCRQPFCIGIGAAFLFVDNEIGGDGSIDE